MKLSEVMARDVVTTSLEENSRSALSLIAELIRAQALHQRTPKNAKTPAT